MLLQRFCGAPESARHGNSLISPKLWLWASAFVFAVSTYGQDVMVERGVKVTMRDGVILRADIYKPKQGGPFPVLLERTPYNKDGGSDFGYRAASAGYIAIIQDVRGRYTSEGEWYPFLHESQDGYDSVEWAAALPQSSGKVGMWGGSYVGATQMLAAISHPPHLAGICPVVTASNYHRNWTYQGGAFEQWFNESWTSGLAQDTLSRRIQRDTNAAKGAWKLPLTAYPLFNESGSLTVNSSQALAPYFLDWLAHPDFDDYWRRWSIEDHYAEVNVPALHTAAWYDIFQDGSLRNYQGLKEKAATEAARRGQRLLVIVGGHAGSGRQIGDVDFGASAADYNETNVTLQWYDYLFKGRRNSFAQKPVRIFVMGVNEWRDEEDWPLQSARSTKYFLHSETGANSVRGDGTLSPVAPRAGEHSDAYVYDPADPVPTIGGPLCCDAAHLSGGPKDQRPAEARQDVLVYSTEAFTSDVEVTGPIALEVYAKSSATDTDFTAKLVDVWPNGFAQNLTEGIARARYRNAQERQELMNPGELYRFAVEMWSTSNVFRRGHRMRLEVSSSNFPRFDRNMNTGIDAASANHWVTATNTIFHDADHASALVIPVVPAR
jgi:putative CocE/NonD family hydrolase